MWTFADDVDYGTDNSVFTSTPAAVGILGNIYDSRWLQVG